MKTAKPRIHSFKGNSYKRKSKGKVRFLQDPERDRTQRYLESLLGYHGMITHGAWWNIC